jgi:hypothetical protein
MCRPRLGGVLLLLDCPPEPLSDRMRADLGKVFDAGHSRTVELMLRSPPGRCQLVLLASNRRAARDAAKAEVMALAGATPGVVP